jgi:hypothetical protein
MLRRSFVERPSPRHGPLNWLRGRVDWVLGLLVVAAWTAVAVEADRSMRASSAATAEALSTLPARNAPADTAAAPAAATLPELTDRQTRI